MCLSSFVCTINEAGSEVMTSGLARLFTNVAEMLSRIRTKGLNCINIFIHRPIFHRNRLVSKFPDSDGFLSNSYLVAYDIDLAYVLNFLSFVDFGPEISPDGSVKHLHHERKQGPCESSVPSTF